MESVTLVAARTEITRGGEKTCTLPRLSPPPVPLPGRPEIRPRPLPLLIEPVTVAATSSSGSSRKTSPAFATNIVPVGHRSAKHEDEKNTPVGLGEKCRGTASWAKDDSKITRFQWDSLGGEDEKRFQWFRTNADTAAGQSRGLITTTRSQARSRWSATPACTASGL